MPFSINNPADAVNAALVRIGWKRQIGTLYDGSEAAQTALSVYGQVRDSMLRDGDWDFAQRDIVLTLLKSAPPGGYIPPTVWNPATNPPLSFNYEYAYPSDCLKVRSLRKTPFFLPDFDPTPIEFSVSNDDYFSPAQRVILTNLPNAVMVYTGRITDPKTWAVDFTEAFIEALAEPLAASLTSLEDAKLDGAESRSDAATANMERG